MDLVENVNSWFSTPIVVSDQESSAPNLLVPPTSEQETTTIPSAISSSSLSTATTPYPLTPVAPSSEAPTTSLPPTSAKQVGNASPPRELGKHGLHSFSISSWEAKFYSSGFERVPYSLQAGGAC